MSGAWAFTPGSGYVWASAYPWGWLPYHYGSWAYQGGIGWFWYPGNSLNGSGVVTNWQGNAPVVNPPAGYKLPIPPPTPANGNRATMLVGTIGRMPAYLPGGPVPPDFRSVIIDHSGIKGMTAPAGGGSNGGATSANAAGARAANSRGMRSASTFATPQQRGYVGQAAHINGSGGHVFATPGPAASPEGWGGGNFGTAASGRGAGMSSGTGMGRAGGTAASHSGSSAPPK
jgi:hypothetical protein